jgi:hypothetical protein
MVARHRPAERLPRGGFLGGRVPPPLMLDVQLSPLIIGEACACAGVLVHDAHGDRGSRPHTGRSYRHGAFTVCGR